MGVLCFRHHAAAIGFCSKGCRRWIKEHGLDYLQFVREGIDEEVFAATNDTMAFRLIEEAKRQKAQDEG